MGKFKRMPLTSTPYPQKSGKYPSNVAGECRIELDRSAFVGNIPIQSVVGLILVGYYIVIAAFLHSLLGKTNPSSFECFLGGSGYIATLLAFSGVYRQQPWKLLPILAIQFSAAVVLIGTWLLCAVEIVYYHSIVTKEKLAIWFVRCLFSLSLMVAHLICVYTIHRYTKTLYVKEAEEKARNVNTSDKAGNGPFYYPDVSTKDETRYYDAHEDPGKSIKCVTFAI